MSKGDKTPRAKIKALCNDARGRHPVPRTTYLSTSQQPFQNHKSCPWKHVAHLEIHLPWKCFLNESMVTQERGMVFLPEIASGKANTKRLYSHPHQIGILSIFFQLISLICAGFLDSVDRAPTGQANQISLIFPWFQNNFPWHRNSHFLERMFCTGPCFSSKNSKNTHTHTRGHFRTDWKLFKLDLKFDLQVMFLRLMSFKVSQRIFIK